MLKEAFSYLLNLLGNLINFASFLALIKFYFKIYTY